MDGYKKRNHLKFSWVFFSDPLILASCLRPSSFLSHHLNHVWGETTLLLPDIHLHELQHLMTLIHQVRTYLLQARCLKITEKVSFNIASKASYVYILSGQKLIKNAKNGPFWRVFENLKLAVKKCYQTGQF